MALSSATCSGCASMNSVDQHGSSYVHPPKLTSDRRPERWNSLDIFVQRERKAVNLFLVLHDEEGVVR